MHINSDKTLSIRTSDCSHDVFNVILVDSSHIKLQYAVLTNYYIKDNNSALKVTYGDNNNIFEVIRHSNKSYSLVSNNLAITLNNDWSLSLETYSETNNNQMILFEKTNYKYFIENEATYSPDGRFISRTKDSTGKIVSYDINNSNGLINSIIDPNNISTNYTYDSKFRTTNITKDNQSVSYEYTNNNLSKITHGTKNYLFNYDEYNNTSSISINNNTLVNNYYENNNGNLARVLYGNNHEINYSYDSFDRVKTIIKSNDTYTNYYDNLGRITKLTSTNDIYKYNYDFASRLSSFVYNNYETNYDYDKNNNAITKHEKLNNHNYTYNYEYNDEDALTKLNINNINFNYNYDYLGRLISNNINNHCNMNYEYITHGNKTSLIVNKVIDNNDTYEYSYDNLYNITEIKKNNSITNKYYYDNHSQLIREDNLIDNITINYTYDNYGNILSKKTYTYNTTTLLDEDTYEYNNSNWQDLLTKFNNESITYDNIGNPTSIGNKTLTWMNGRELATYSDGTNTISYKYNLNGIRTSKTINNITTYYYLEDRSVIFEDRNGIMLYYLYNGDELLGFIYNNNTYYYHKNMFEDIIGIYDSNYNEIVTYKYDSWGVIKNITDNSNINLGIINPFRYRSYYYDEETQLYYLNSRYYNPEIGRFINADKYINASKTIISNNLFVYADNCTINYSDENGNSMVSVLIKSVKKSVRKIIKVIRKIKSSINQYKVSIQEKKEATKELADKFKETLKINSRAFQDDKDPLQKLLVFRNSFTNGSTFDIKLYSTWRGKKIYYEGEWMEDQDLGNYHYGYVGAASGYKKEFLILAAGLNQLKTWKLKTAKHCISRSLCDDPRDTYFIEKGYDAYYRDK